jgi:group I intron endonuclease
MIDSGIYLIVNKINGHRYIGQTTSFKTRFENYRYSSRVHGPIGRAIKKHGIRSFRFSIIKRCRPKNLRIFEFNYIAKMRPEYNVAFQDAHLIDGAGNSRVLIHAEMTALVVKRNVFIRIKRMAKKEGLPMTRITDRLLAVGLAQPKQI